MKHHEHTHHSCCGHDHCGCGHDHHHHESHASCGCGCGCDHHDHGPEHARREGLGILIGAALFALVLLLEHGQAAQLAVLALSLAGYLLLGGEILMQAAQNLLKGRVLDENFLMGIATLGAFAIRNYPEALGVMLFYRVGEYFEHKAVEKSRKEIMSAVDLRPEVVSRVQDGEIAVIPAGEARVGDVLLIRPGDRIPLDGAIIEGESRLDTAPITGEPVPVRVCAGDSVLSGCVNGDGRLLLRVEKPLEQSMVSRILECVESAAAGKPRIDRFITRFARVYTPCVVIAALLTAVVPPLLGGSWNYWVYTALSFLVISCPCALVLSVPLAFFSGIGAGSRKGILFKGGAAMEAMGKLKAVVLDKTGTVTRGDFRLQKIIPCADMNEDELLALCAACEQGSTHPIALSILAAARERGIAVEAPDSMREKPGYGVEARIHGRQVLCGSRRLMEAHNIPCDAEDALHGARVWAAVDGRPAGVLVIADTVKPDAQAAISDLKAMGLHTAMLTGDGEDAARAVAAETGIDQVHARLLPGQKLELLKKIRSEQGAVMFVGDGINDAPVLAGADVGAAMGSGADAAIEAADAVFMHSAVQSIPDAICIARRTGRIAMQNVVFALAVKLLVMILGLCGYANMWLAVFADTGVAMLCVLNSIRALAQK